MYVQFPTTLNCKPSYKPQPDSKIKSADAIVIVTKF
jgi:hypothetical protein